MTRCRTTWRTGAWLGVPDAGNSTPATTISGRTWLRRPPRLVTRPRSRGSSRHRSPGMRQGAVHELAATDAGDPALIHRRVRTRHGPPPTSAVGGLGAHAHGRAGN